MGKRLLACVLVVAAAGCGGITVPPCLLDGSCLPTPAPSAPPSPVPAPSPSPTPAPSPSPAPQPSPSPTAPPTPAPSPEPSATPEPPPPPSPSPAAGDACPAPVAIKLGFRSDPRALNPGFANTASITPIVANTAANRAPCAYRGLTGANDVCAVNEFCADHVGSAYESRYGQPEAFQDGAGFTGDPVERSTDGCTVIVAGVPHVPCGYNLKFATGGAANYPGGRYREAGPMRVCVSLPGLPWRCQKGEMGEDGRLVGFGENSRGFDVAKP